jgi:hypothetical protein
MKPLEPPLPGESRSEYLARTCDHQWELHGGRGSGPCPIPVCSYCGTVKKSSYPARRENEYREPGNGKFSYFGDFDRLCKCGHSLGVHIAGGFECGTDPTDESAGCACQRFKPSGKRQAAAHKRC